MSFRITRITTAMLLTFFLAWPQVSYSQTVNSCRTDNQDSLYLELQDRARTGYKTAHDNFDYQYAVASAWRSADMTHIIASAAQSAGDDYRWDSINEVFLRRCTGWSKGCAERAASFIGNRTFSSSSVKTGFEVVVEGAVNRLLDHFEQKSSEVSSTLGSCFSEFLNVSYPPIIQAAAIKHLTQLNETLDVRIPQREETGLNVPLAAISGALLLALAAVRRRIVRRIAGQISKKIAGKLLSRAIPYVGWALLVLEVLFAGNGSIPAIVSSMSSDDVVANLQDEFSSEIEAEIERQLDPISTEIVKGTMSTWRNFMESNEVVLGLSKTNPRFEQYLQKFSREDDLVPIREAVALVVELGGEEALLDMIDKNKLSSIVQLPPEGHALARVIDSIDTAIAWHSLSGDKLTDVVDHRLYQYKAPADLTKSSLDFLLSFEDRNSVRKVALLSSESLVALQQVDHESSVLLVKTLEPELLKETLSNFTLISHQEARNMASLYISGSSYDPSLIAGYLQSVGLSNDQLLAAKLLFETNFFDRFSPTVAKLALKGALDGKISWQLLWEKYTVHAVIVGGGLLIFLLQFARIFRPRYQQVVVKHEQKSD